MHILSTISYLAEQSKVPFITTKIIEKYLKHLLFNKEFI